MSNKTKPSDIAGTRAIIQAAYQVLEQSCIKDTGYELHVLLDEKDTDEQIVAELESALGYIKSGLFRSHVKQEQERREPQFAVWCDGTSCHVDDLDDYQWMSDDYSLKHVDPNDEPEPLFPPELAARADQDVIDRNGWEHPCDDGHEHDEPETEDEHDYLSGIPVELRDEKRRMMGIPVYLKEQGVPIFLDEMEEIEPNYDQLGEMIEERERFLYEETGSSNEPKNCEQLERNICEHQFDYYDRATNETKCRKCGNWFRGSLVS